MGCPQIAIIIPTLNEAGCVGRTLESVRQLDVDTEVLVVDGGSSDATVERVRDAGTRFLVTNRGRGLQLHAGACATSAPILWFVHADTIVPEDSATHILKGLKSADVAGGNFGLTFDGDSRGARQLTFLYPKLRHLGLCYGDSGIFIRRTAYEKIGGFRPYPIFEDLDLLRRMKQHGRFVHLDACLTTSSRRFEGRSFVKTFAHWTTLQVLFWLGVSPIRLNRWYAPIRASKQA